MVLSMVVSAMLWVQAPAPSQAGPAATVSAAPPAGVAADARDSHARFKDALSSGFDKPVPPIRTYRPRKPTEVPAKTKGPQFTGGGF
ncbi:hypothetical protein HY57_02040 [Dyella japonica A8]|uniref:Uncharacterized protein n=1 Tax=Dyella japonica A8 TaxID=1217721 RepID=A0A075K1K3_9GAMM|nr:hypothetical protein HY57_02040 [Dyella japonica A8]